MPTTPQKEAGSLIEPPVSDPRAATAMSDATAAAEPPEEPPGTRLTSCGFLVIWKAEFSVELPIANSSKLVLPKNTALLSFKAIGTPAKELNFSPLAKDLSTSLALVRASLLCKLRNAFISLSLLSI